MKKKSKLRNKIEDAVLIVIAIVIVGWFTIFRGNTLAGWRASSQGTVWEPVVELLSLGER